MCEMVGLIVLILFVIYYLKVEVCSCNSIFYKLKRMNMQSEEKVFCRMVCDIPTLRDVIRDIREDF